MRDKWRQIGIGAGIALLLAAAAPMVSAQNTNEAPGPFMGRGMRGGPPPGGPAGLPLGRLGLSDQQRDQVRSIMDGHRDDQQAIGDRLRQAHDALEHAVQSGTFDEGAVRQAAMALGEVETDAAVLRARIVSEVFQILTPEQQSQLRDLETRLAERSGPRGRGPRGPSPDGGGNVGR